MSPSVLFLLTLLLPTTLVLATTDASKCTVRRDVVKCDYMKTFCKCGEWADVCEFSFSIRRFHSFSKYYIDRDYNEIIPLARLFYFDEQGNLNGHPDANQPFCKNDTENAEDPSEYCTPPHIFDGSTFRSFIGVNGQVPGPTLIVWKDQTVVVNVRNDLLMETVSIHWHGMYQYDSYFMDGVHHITQNPIDPQRSFRYIFKADPSGTHWYHSHTGVQQADGLFGALIVKEREEFVNRTKEALRSLPKKAAQDLETYLDQPEDHTIIISDWYRESAIEAYTMLESALWFYENSGRNPPGIDDRLKLFSHGPDGKEAGNYPFWSALINGKGKHPDSEYSYVKSRLHIFSVDPGEVYRFRMIGAINNFFFRFSIDEHKLYVVGTDGHWVEPVEVDYIGIHAGERYDFLLITKPNPSKYDYWMRSETQETHQEDAPPTGLPPYGMRLHHAAESILHYNSKTGDSLPKSMEYEKIKNNSNHVNCSPSDRCEMMNCPWKIHDNYNLCCLYVDSLRLLLPSHDNLPDATVTKDKEIFFQFGTEGVARLSSVNGRRLVSPSVPLGMINESDFEEFKNAEFCKELQNPNMCADQFQETFNPNCSCVHVQDLEYNNTYQMVYTVVGEGGTFSHPVHMHGHSFWVLQIGKPETDSRTGFVRNHTSQDIACNPPSSKLCTSPQWVDGRNYNYDGKTYDGKIDPHTVRKDTLVVPAGGYAVIRMVTDNPGVWFMHCHVENHLVEGMAVILNEARPYQKPSPPEIRISGNFEPCLDDYFDCLDDSTATPQTEATTQTPTTKPGSGSKPDLFDAIDQALYAATYQGCAAAGYSGCCTEGDCKAASGCYCDVTCYYFHTCCDDITANGCYPPQRRELFFNQA